MEKMEDINKGIQNKSFEGDLSRYIEFSLGNQEYAIPLLTIREVISMPETTPIPNSPPHFVGLMNLRGQVISVVDIRKKLKIKPNEKQEENAVMIVNIDQYSLGMVVDSVNKVLSIPNADIKEVPEMHTQIQAQYINGIYRKSEGNLTILLDVTKVLDLKDLQTLKKAA